MKAFILLSVFFLCCAADLRAEEVLARRLSVTFRDTPLKSALDEIARLADFEWSYNAGMLDATQHITLTARDWTVREILREMLGENYAYKSSGRYLIIKRQKASRSELSGVVRDPKTGERLSNVTVYDRKTLRATTTDSSGYYRLKIKNKGAVVIARLGYRDTVLQVSSISPRYQKINLAPLSAPVADTTGLKEKIRKSLRQTATELEYIFSATLDHWNDLNVPDTLKRRFQLSFLPNIGTNHVLSGKVFNNLSVNMLAGQSAGVRGAEVAGLGNFTKKEVAGFQAAGLFNINRGNCSGVQAAGVINQTADTLSGLQLAGVANLCRQAPDHFLQVAGLINVVHKNDGLPSDSTAVTKGVQLAGLANTSEEMEGVQAAGMFNRVKEMEGIQVAGLFNHARRMRGFQIGLFNNANELHGLQIGLLNRSGKRWLPVLNWGR